MDLLPGQGEMQRDRQDRFFPAATKTYPMQPSLIIKPGKEQIAQALQPAGEDLDALDEMIATVEAIFYVINQSDLDEPAKNALYRLEKHFNFYVQLLSSTG